MADDILTKQQAFLAMFAFLEIHFQRFGPSELGTVLGEISLLPDGSTFDSAAWDDWMSGVEKAKRGEVDASFGWGEQSKPERD